MARGVSLNRTRKVPADETPAFGAIAERFRRAGDLERAVALCQDGLKRFPRNLSARVTLGWALLDLGRYDEAREALESVLKRAPDNLAAIRGLAELHDRAEHTMMLPMDGPGQWPPPVDSNDQTDAADAADLGAATAALQADGADAFEFPPPLTIPIPTPAMDATDLDPEIGADAVALAADALFDAPAPPAEPLDAVAAFAAAEPKHERSASTPPVPPAPAPVPIPVTSFSSVEDPVFLSASGAPLPVAAAATPASAIEAPPVHVAEAGTVVEPAASSAGETVPPPVDAVAARVAESVIEPVIDLETAAADLGLALTGAALSVEEAAAPVPEVADLSQDQGTSLADVAAALSASQDASAAAPAAAAFVEAIAAVEAAVKAEDQEEIAALEALLARAESDVEVATAVEAPMAQVETTIAIARPREAPIAQTDTIVEVAEPDVEDPFAFRLEAQSIMALQALPVPQEPQAEELAAMNGVAGDLPLIAVSEQSVPEPEPMHQPEPEPQLVAMALAEAVPAVVSPLTALERFLGRVQARRLRLATESVA
jgi:tetratricopeptide (TPR) repeat protein